MSEFENALNELDDRAKEGKTASRLIEAATTEIQLEQSRRRDAESQREQMVSLTDELRTALEEEHMRVVELKKPRIEIDIDGPVVNHVLGPAGGFDKNRRGDGIGLWRLEELEGALMHLRMAGAASDTQIRMVEGKLVAKIATDLDLLPDGWNWDAPEPKVIVKKRGPWWIWMVSVGAGIGGIIAGLTIGMVA